MLAFLIFFPRQAFAQAGKVSSETVISEPIRVDKLYKSMEGPYVKGPIPVPVVDDATKAELLWLKKVSLEFIDGKEDAPRAMDYLCHGHVLMDDTRVPALFTLIHGQNAVELPANFAVPVLSKHPLLYYAQILNLKETQEPFDLRVKATLDYIRDSDVVGRMKPLYQMSMILKVPIGLATAAMIAENQHCSLASKDGAVEIVSSGSLGLRSDSQGNPFSIHWMVPPGKHTYSYDVQTEEIRASAGATVHFATIHLHPYGRSMELFDLTENAPVFRIAADIDERSGAIRKVNHFTSEEGVLRIQTISTG
jgi:hypothetical protein